MCLPFHLSLPGFSSYRWLLVCFFIACSKTLNHSLYPLIENLWIFFLKAKHNMSSGIVSETICEELLNVRIHLASPVHTNLIFLIQPFSFFLMAKGFLLYLFLCFHSCTFLKDCFLFSDCATCSLW